MRVCRLVLRTVAAVVLAVAIGPAIGGDPVHAHNTFVSSDPAAGAVLPAAPATISMVFTGSVPLDTTSVLVIDAAGARTEIEGLTHGPAGDTVVVAPLPPLGAGEVTVRWRLVGPDGHPLTDRITFTIAAASIPATSVPATAVPAAGAPTPSPTTMVPVAVSPAAGADDAAAEPGLWTPEPLRWLLRYGSYLAIMIVVGIVLTDRLVWPGLAARPAFRTAVTRCLVAVAVLAVLQLLVIASDISGEAPWASLGSLDAALTTGAGMAMAVRALIAAGVWAVLFALHVADDEVRWVGVSLAGVALLGTWAWAGHSATQRWPELGVPLDVAHHGAAAVWVGALAIIGCYAMRRLDGPELGPVMARLSRVATVSVAVVVATGLVQAARLVGSPWQLFDARHGVYLAVKVALLVAMLAVATVNRQRVQRDLAQQTPVLGGLVARLRRSMVIEFGVGLAIIAVTAAMVVSPPATSTTPDRDDVAVAGR